MKMDKSAPVLVLYHGRCADGFCAAWLLHRIYPQGTYVPVQYGSPPPDCTGKQVYIVDFSYPYADLVAIARSATALTIIDHHASVLQDLQDLREMCAAKDLPQVVVRADPAHSGARLTWDYLVEQGMNRTRPWVVDYTEDRDLWTWNLKHSKAINAALRSYPMDFEVWNVLASGTLSSYVDEGYAILRMEREIVAEHVARAGEIELDGHRVLCVNATALYSEIAGELAEGRPFGVCYQVLADGTCVYSLRSTERGVDVSVIAARHGGGGHVHAAGYRGAQIPQRAQRVGQRPPVVGY